MARAEPGNGREVGAWPGPECQHNGAELGVRAGKTSKSKYLPAPKAIVRKIWSPGERQLLSAQPGHPLRIPLRPWPPALQPLPPVCRAGAWGCHRLPSGSGAPSLSQCDSGSGAAMLRGWWPPSCPSSPPGPRWVCDVAALQGTSPVPPPPPRDPPGTPKWPSPRPRCGTSRQMPPKS